jgi:hypothetical protein
VLTERQWNTRIRQRRELAAQAAELEERICTALETRGAKLEEVRIWLNEVEKVYQELQVSGYPFFTKKKAFTDDDLVARLGTIDQRQACEERQIAVRTDKTAKELVSMQRYDVERLSHPKLAQPPKCLRPERLHCDYYDEFSRCEFMAYGGRLGYWLCTAIENSSHK